MNLSVCAKAVVRATAPAGSGILAKAAAMASGVRSASGEWSLKARDADRKSGVVESKPPHYPDAARLIEAQSIYSGRSLLANQMVM
jgi:hypothetical protein